MEFAKVRLRIFSSLVQQKDADVLDEIFAEVQKRGGMVQNQFRAGVVLSMIFVGVLVVARCLK